MASKLDLILTQVEKLLNDRFEKSEAKQDIRFEVIKSEFQLVRSEMTEEFAAVRTEMAQGFAEVRKEFVAVRKDLTIVRDQTAHVTERLTVLEQAQTPSSQSL